MDNNSFGPEDQLRTVIKFAKRVSGKVGEDNPLAEMDFFYALIMHQVPPKVRMTVRKILLAYCVVIHLPVYITAALDLSEEQFRQSCASIQSVVELQSSKLRSMRLHFYHASFLDFMKDPERSRDLCVYGKFLIDYRRERLDWLHHVCSRSKGPSDIIFSSEPVLPKGWNCNQYYSEFLCFFFRLCGILGRPFDPQSAASLEKLDFRMMLRLTGDITGCVGLTYLLGLRHNLRNDLRAKIIRWDK